MGKEREGVQTQGSSSLDPRIIVYAVFTNVFFAFEIMATRSYAANVPILLASLAAISLFPSRPAVQRLGIAATLLFHVRGTFSRMPSVWDSDVWVLQANVAVALWLLIESGTKAKAKEKSKGKEKSTEAKTTINDSDSDSEDAAILWRTLRDQFSCFYFAAGFWKLNSHFWDPNASCSTMFVVQLIAQYLTPVLSSSDDRWLIQAAALGKATAPLTTLVVELSMGGSMLLGGALLQHRASERFGVLLTLFFHFLVCCVPRPNDISGFALNCGTSLICFCSLDGTLKAMALVKRWRQDIGVAMVAILLAAARCSGSSSYEITPNNWAFLFYTAVASFLAYALIVEDTASKEALQPIKRTPFVYTGLVIALLYSFGGLMTGLLEEATPNMFANLKVHGGSNHWILPTGLLLHNDYPDAHVLGGGIIRIEETTSHWLQWIYPADLTSLLHPANAVSLLEAVGNPSPSYFNPGASRILRLAPPPDPSSFIQYTVPALEFKRLWREAKEADRNFAAVFSQLPGTGGDEEWRASAARRRFAVRVRDGAVAECRVTDFLAGATGSEAATAECAPADLPMLPDGAVPAIVRKFTMHHAYPIVRNQDGTVRPTIACFGP